MNPPHSRSPHSARAVQRVDRRSLLVAGVLATALCAFFAVAADGKGGADTAAAAAAQTLAATQPAPASGDVTPAAAAQTGQTPPSAAPVTVQSTDASGVPAATAAPAPAAADPSTADAVQDLDGEDLTNVDVCLMDVLSLRIGATGQSVVCLQQALIDGGFYDGALSGEFDNATYAAVEQMQTDRNLFVDGVVGRESAISLGIWPDEESFVVRTPKPPEGSMDLMGYPLSSVASAGDNAPALPPNSGSGRRIVYDRAGQRVWAVDGDERIIRSWLISGSKYSNELPGTHEVYSKSDVSTAWNGKAYLPLMVRWLKTDIGAIGFHSIPLHVEDRSPYQTEAELGTRLSGGCQRQAPRDAQFLWDFADIGTKVVVI
jgi:peptidoglycan hydrolase-like protein with peptidoglycan-binding domain